MYVACAVSRDAHATPDMILHIDPAAIEMELVKDCYERVFKHYVELTTNEYPEPSGERAKAIASHQHRTTP